MPIKHVNGTVAFEFEVFQDHPLNQAIYTRHGGVSSPPWRSLNVGGTVGDAPQHVEENRRRVFDASGRKVTSLHDVWQVHSADVVLADQPRGMSSPIKADIILSTNPDVTLFMRFADCVPIFLYDPHTPAIGIAHAGWLGTVRQAAEAAVGTMVERFGSSPAYMVAGIGPSICSDHYPVGPEVIDQFKASFGAHADDHLIQREGRVHLDLWSANRFLLEQQGLSTIEIAGICTVCDNQDWYSHRAEMGRTGRFAALFNLERE